MPVSRQWCAEPGDSLRHNRAVDESLIALAVVFAFPGFALALVRGRWWIPWLVPAGWAAVYSLGWFIERRNPGGEDDTELLLITGVAVVGASIGLVVAGLALRRLLDRRGGQ